MQALIPFWNVDFEMGLETISLLNATRLHYF